MKRLAFAALCLVAASAFAVHLPIRIIGGTDGTIVPDIVESRSSGVAPLYVHFDATATASSVTSREFHDVECVWNFDDPAGGATWAPTGLSKNAARGLVAAHVFETPGTYDVVLTCDDDGDGTGTNDTVQITVTDPDTVFAGTATICIRQAATGTFDGCPSGASQVTQSNLGTALNTYALGGQRALFRRGDTWTAGGAVTILHNSNTARIVGAFGSGAKPKWTLPFAGSAEGISVSHSSTPNFGNLRMMDIEIDGTSGDSSGIDEQGPVTGFLMLRLDIHDIAGSAVQMNEFTAQSTFLREIAIVDSTLTDSRGGYLAYFAADKAALLGNTMTNAVNGVGVFRTQYFTKSVIQHNLMTGSPFTFHLVKFGAGKSSGGPAFYDNVPSEFWIVSDNVFDDSTGDGGWVSTWGPENGSQAEIVRDGVIERNHWIANPDAYSMLKLFCHNVTVRNEIIDMRTTAGNPGDSLPVIHIDKRGIEPDPDGNHIYNVTIYYTGTYDGGTFGFVGVRMESTADATEIRNNIGYAPNVSTPVMVSDGGTNTVQSTNSNNTQMKSTNPFADTTPVLAAEFVPSNGAYTDDAGTAIPVWVDFFQSARTGTNDLGAIIH